MPSRRAVLQNTRLCISHMWISHMWISHMYVTVSVFFFFLTPLTPTLPLSNYLLLCVCMSWMYITTVVWEGDATSKLRRLCQVHIYTHTHVHACTHTHSCGITRSPTCSLFSTNFLSHIAFSQEIMVTDEYLLILEKYNFMEALLKKCIFLSRSRSLSPHLLCLGLLSLPPFEKISYTSTMTSNICVCIYTRPRCCQRQARHIKA